MIVTIVGGAVVGCGSDVGRFSDNPFANPFSGSARFDGQGQQQQAAAVQQSSQPAQRVAPVTQSTAVSSAPLPAPGANSAPVQTASVAAPKSTGPAPMGWTAQGGSAVTLGKGETLKTLSDRYGVPEAALRSANNIAGQPAPGSSIVIPVYNANGSAAPAAAAPTRTAAVAPTAPSAPAVTAPPAKAALVNGKLVAPTQAAATVAPAQVAAVAPGAKPVAGKLEPQKAEPAKSTQLSAIEATKPDPKALAKAQADAKIDPKAAKLDPKAAAKAAAETAKAEAKAKEVETTASIAPNDKAAAPSTEFRWPARGRVIAGFGSKSGQNNDGINIAVPEGTPVKAAEGGVVAYAGNELKGYGNLVLVRHDNGWVTAYAHNGDLKVKRGEQVKRGQVIATSGQSGNVSSPQIHFELRKGSTPVDPMEHLSSN